MTERTEATPATHGAPSDFALDIAANGFDVHAGWPDMESRVNPHGSKGLTTRSDPDSSESAKMQFLDLSQEASTGGSRPAPQVVGNQASPGPSDLAATPPDARLLIGVALELKDYGLALMGGEEFDKRAVGKRLLAIGAQLVRHLPKAEPIRTEGHDDR